MDLEERRGWWSQKVFVLHLIRTLFYEYILEDGMYSLPKVIHHPYRRRIGKKQVKKLGKKKEIFIDYIMKLSVEKSTSTCD